MIGDFLSHLLGDIVGDALRGVFSRRPQPLVLPVPEGEQALLGGVAAFVGSLGLGASILPLLSVFGDGATRSAVLLLMGLSSVPCMGAALIARRLLRGRSGRQVLAWIGLWTGLLGLAGNAVALVAWAVLK